MAIVPNINRRRLWTSAATITVTGILPNIAHTEALADVQIVHQKKPLAPSADVQARNFGSVTVLRLRNILERNAIRQEAGLPLLSVPKELRRMKKAADAEKFRKFADAHQEGVYHKMLAKVQRQCGDPNWAPTSMLSAMWFGAQVNRELSTLFRRNTVGRDGCHKEWGSAFLDQDAIKSRCRSLGSGLSHRCSSLGYDEL